MAKKKRLTRAQKARRRRAAQQVTDTNSNLAFQTLPMTPQDGVKLITGTTEVQNRGPLGLDQAPHVRLPTTATGKLRMALEAIEQKEFDAVVASLVADATTAEDPKARIAAANAISRMAKVCDETTAPGITVNGNLSVTPDTGRNRVAEAAARLGIRFDNCSDVEGSATRVS
jgi:hypothetical protein